MEILEERPVPWVEAKKVLESKAKEKELGYEQKNALEHLKKFSKLGVRAGEELCEKLSGLRLKERQVAAIMNFLPLTVDELRLLLAYDSASLSEEEKKSILSGVKSAIG